MSQEWEQPVLQVHREPLPLGACTMSTKISSTRSGEHSSTRMTVPRGTTPTQGISRCMPMGEVDHSIRAVLLLSHTTSTTSLTISQQLCGVNSHMPSSTTRFSMEVSGQTRMVSTCASLRCMVLHQLPNLAKTTLTWLWACPTLTSSDSDTLHHGMVSDFASFILIHLICPCALVGNQSKAIKQIDPEGGRVDGGPNDQSM